MKRDKLRNNALLKSTEVPDRPRESLEDFLARGGEVRRVEPARAYGAEGITPNHFSLVHGDGNRWVGHKGGGS